jgi:DNA-binding transcriptional LysR family regulator
MATDCYLSRGRRLHQPHRASRTDPGRFTPRIASHSDDMVVVQALVAAGVGVATLPGLALKARRRPDIHTTEFASFHRQINAATYGDPPHPPVAAAVVAALTEAFTPTTSTADAPPSPARPRPRRRQPHLAEQPTEQR